MSKHGAEHTRVERDLYPRPSWVVGALAEHVDAPANAAAELPYDAAADFAGSLDDCYAAVRARKAQGGKGWTPR